MKIVSKCCGSMRSGFGLDDPWMDEFIKDKIYFGKKLRSFLGGYNYLMINERGVEKRLSEPEYNVVFYPYISLREYLIDKIIDFDSFPIITYIPLYHHSMLSKKLYLD